MWADEYRSLFVQSQKAERPSSASQDHPLPCVSAAYLTKKSINAQNRCVQLSVLHKGRVLSNRRREKWHLTATIKVAIKLHLFISNTNCCLIAKIVKAASLSRCLGSYVCRGLNILPMWTFWDIFEFFSPPYLSVNAGGGSSVWIIT